MSNPKKSSSFATANWCLWQCPICGAYHKDPPHLKTTSCDKGHIVVLGDEYKPGWREAEIIPPKPDLILDHRD